MGLLNIRSETMHGWQDIQLPENKFVRTHGAIQKKKKRVKNTPGCPLLGPPFSMIDVMILSEPFVEVLGASVGILNQS